MGSYLSIYQYIHICNAVRNRKMPNEAACNRKKVPESDERDGRANLPENFHRRRLATTKAPSLHLSSRGSQAKF